MTARGRTPPAPGRTSLPRPSPSRTPAVPVSLRPVHTSSAGRPSAQNPHHPRIGQLSRCQQPITRSPAIRGATAHSLPVRLSPSRACTACKKAQRRTKHPADVRVRACVLFFFSPRAGLCHGSCVCILHLHLHAPAVPNLQSLSLCSVCTNFPLAPVCPAIPFASAAKPLRPLFLDAGLPPGQ